MSGKAKVITLPADRRPGAADAAFTRPWFAAERHGKRPAILTFVGTDESFVDAFFRGVTESGGGFRAGAFPRLLPARDFAEPPRALFDGSGEPVYTRAHVEPPAAERPGAGELELDGKASFEEALIEAGVGTTVNAVRDVVFPPAGDASRASWLRKLYLPMHTHFHVVACELFCDRPGAPRIDGKRVLEAGLVVRRFVPDTTSAKPRWQDWIASPLGGGTWVEIAGEDMKALHGTARVLDPALLPADVLGPADLETRRHLGVDAAAPLALSTAPLAPVPVTTGEARQHTCRFGYLPLPAADKERPLADPSDDVAAIRDQFVATAEAHLNERLVQKAATIGARVQGALLPLLQEFRDKLPISFFQLDQVTVLDPAKVAVAAVPGVVAAEIDGITRLLGLAALAHYVNAEIVEDAPLSDQARWDKAVTRVADLFSSTLTHEYRPTLPGQPPSPWAKNAFALAKPSMSLLMRDAVHDAVTQALPAGGGLGDPIDPIVLVSLLLWVWRERHLALDTFYGSAFTGGAAKPDFKKPQIDLSSGKLLRVRPTVTALGEELDAWMAVDESRAADPVPWPSPSPPPSPASLKAHRLARDLEEVMADVGVQGAGAGGGYAAELDQRSKGAEGPLNTALGFAPLGHRALNLSAALERGLLVFPGTSPSETEAQALVTAVRQQYLSKLTADALRTQGKAFRQVVRPRFDADSLYAVFCFARVAGRDPCETPQVVWSRRTEVFFLAEPMDMLGLKPVAMRLPDLPKLLRDVPRMKRARALPFAAMTTPQNSGVVTGEDPKDTAREWGIAWICSFAIPVFTLCAWVMFSLIFSILLAIPGFAWMLLLKICIPVPAPKKA